MERNFLVCQNEGWAGSHSQLTSYLALDPNFLYQANPNTAVAITKKKGRAGSNQEKVEAKLLVPAIKASTGVMQQRELISAAIMLLLNREFLIIPELILNNPINRAMKT